MHVPFPLQCWDVIEKLRGYNNIAKGRGKTKGSRIFQSVSRFLSKIVASSLKINFSPFISLPVSTESPVVNSWCITARGPAGKQVIKKQFGYVFNKFFDNLREGVGRGIVRKALDPPTPYSTPAKQASPFLSCLKPLYLCKANRSQASPGLSLGCVLLTSNAMIPLRIARKKKYICKHNGIISFPYSNKKHLLPLVY